MVAEVGGYYGLLIGVSLLDTVGLLLMVCNMLKGYQRTSDDGYVRNL